VEYKFHTQENEMHFSVSVTPEDLEQIDMDAEELSQAVRKRLESGLEDDDGTVYLNNVHVEVAVKLTPDGQPKVYSTKLNEAQNMACHRMEAISGVPPVGLQELDDGVLSPKEFWRLNLVNLHDISTTVQNLDFQTD
jgi:hypothetical protein